MISTLSRHPVGAGKVAPFSVWLFENYAHELLLKGGTFQQRSLHGDDTVTSPLIVINPTVAHYTRFNLEEKSLDAFFVETYQMPKSASLASADSYYLTGDGIWMFQITRSFNRGVGLEGFLELLKSLDLLERVAADPSFAKLVFVVPTKHFATFWNQAITKAVVFSAGMSVDEIKLCDCSEMVSGVQASKKRKLDRLGITNIGQLIDPDNAQVVSFVKSHVESFKEILTSMVNAHAMVRIEKSVIVISYQLPDSKMKLN